MSTLALIGLGSNLGDRKAHLDLAVASLSRTPSLTVRAVSPYHETNPVGGPEAQGAFMGGDGAGLQERLQHALPAVAVEDRINVDDPSRMDTSSSPDDELGLGSFEAAARWLARRWNPLPARWLCAATLGSSVPTETWLVSRFWFDTLFLALVTLKSSRSRFPHFREEFLEARSEVLPATFVVPSPKDRQRFGIKD